VSTNIGTDAQNNDSSGTGTYRSIICLNSKKYKS